MCKIFLLICLLFTSIVTVSQNPKDLVQLKTPLLLEGDGIYLSKLTYYSYFLKGIEGQRPGLSYIKDSSSNKKIGVNAINVLLLHLISESYFDERIGEDQFNRIVIEVKDPERIKLTNKTGKSEKDEWTRNNSWCYNLKVSVEQSESIKTIIQEDLKRYFNLTASVEKRKVKCLALIRTSDVDKLRALDTTLKSKYIVMKTGEKRIQNGGIKTLIFFLREANLHLATPIIDCTDYTGPVDLKLNASFRDIGQIRSDIRKYDLDLVERELEIDMIVVRDADSNKKIGAL